MTTHARPIDKEFEDADDTGILVLAGRNLRGFPGVPADQCDVGYVFEAGKLSECSRMPSSAYVCVCVCMCVCVCVCVCVLACVCVCFVSFYVCACVYACVWAAVMCDVACVLLGMSSYVCICVRVHCM